ncbi:MAG: hypothetical protein NZ869_06370 [Thermoanaerobaculum sp.]|nr:hypothetical protein [Thermoanaerobaculum sp.]MDW7966892.1 hypothetical protein [Thermoanaerobaculum sp.]
MATPWVLLGTASEELALHLGWDLLGQPAPQLRVLPVSELAVVLPRSRDPQREVYLDRCRADRVPVLFRPSGGGAVVLAPGMLTVSVWAPWPGAKRVELVFRHFCGLLASAVTQAGGPPLALRGVSDLCVGDRKAVGCSLRLGQQNVLFQASVLVHPNLELLHRYLPFPSRAPDYRRGRPHREFVTTLRAAGCPLTTQELGHVLGQAFAQRLACDGRSG